MTRSHEVESISDSDIPVLRQSFRSFQSSSTQNFDMPPKCPHRKWKDVDSDDASDISFHNCQKPAEHDAHINFNNTHRFSNDKRIANVSFSSRIGMEITIVSKDRCRKD
jgi:hypothetical protein